MPPPLTTGVQLHPFAVPVKGYAVLPLVQLIQSLELIVFDRACVIDVEESESNLILGVWFRKEIFERCPVSKGDLARLLSVSDTKENCILLSFYLVLNE